jgi:ubiquinone/menaquinone biosynthesis C-methylase UbiE
MIFQQYLARQLSKPTGIIGKFVLGPLWNKRNAKLNEVTFVHLELKEEDRVLDIGFGGGYLLERIIPKVKLGLVAGMDVSPVMVGNFRARYQADIKAGRVDIQCGRVETSPYPDEHFTKVSSVNSIFYWSDAQQGLAEIYRILQEEGKIVLTYTCKRDLAKKKFVQYGVKTYEEEEVQQMLVRAGFKDIKEVRTWDQHREFICVTGRK